MTDEPNIGLPRDPALAEFALELFHMNQPGWPRRVQQHVAWPTEKSYRWTNERE